MSFNRIWVQLLHSSRQFTGLPHEEPQVHLQNFENFIRDQFVPAGVSINYVRLMLIPISLLGDAKKQLACKFHHIMERSCKKVPHPILPIFPSGKTAKLRTEIMGFTKKPEENLCLGAIQGPSQKLPSSSAVR